MRSKVMRVLIVPVLAVLAVLALLVAQPAGAAHGPTVVLWNHLNNRWSVQHSVVGADFHIVGMPVFRKGVSGKAIGVIDDESLLLMPAQKFFGADKTQGTVSVFLQKRMVASVPYETPFNGIFGTQPYDFQDAWCQNPSGEKCTNAAISAVWGSGSGSLDPSGLWLQVIDTAGTVHQAVDPAFNTRAVPVGVWVHAQFVWDIRGIKGTRDTIRIYRDGKVVARYSQPIPDVLDLPTPVAVAGSHAAYRLNRPALLMDELRVFDRAVTP
jgi:hypothetical protein